jgi:hypothetical protein
MSTMNLRSGRSLMRRDSRNLEEFQERRRYQREQKAIEATLYDDEEEATELAKKMNKFNHKLRHLLYVNQYQKDENHNFNEKMQTVIDIYQHIRYNIDDLIQYYNNEHSHDKRLLESIVKKGNTLILEIYNKKRTREEHKKFKKCEYLILFVSDLIEHYILN